MNWELKVKNRTILVSLVPMKWSSVNRELPKDSDWKIVTILDEHGDTPYRYTDFGWYLEEANCWIVEAERRTDVIAWSPLPEPYKEEEDD